MSYGKMNSFINIVSSAPVIDAEGFATKGETVLASIRAYKEERHGSERLANMAAFSSANALFRFRKIPGVDVDESLVILCEGGRYKILNAELVRGMYIEVLAEKIEPTVR